MDEIRAARAAVVRSLGATPEECEELLDYGRNRFQVPRAIDEPVLPLADESFAATWREWAAEAADDKSGGAWPVLRRELPQLSFPVAAGMSATSAYRAATLSGVFSEAPVPSLKLERPEVLHLSVHGSLAGAIGIVATPHRHDFELLIQCFFYRNEPAAISPATGACMIGGLVNWRLLHAIRDSWRREVGDAATATAWRSAVRDGRWPRDLYQDRFIVLTDGPYSGVAAERLGLEASAWVRLSGILRLEHECTHYLTRRAFGSMSTALLDEVLADYAGIVASAGTFQSDWFTAFMEQRLANYRAALSDGAVRVLHRLANAVTLEIRDFDGRLPMHRSADVRWHALCALASFTLEEMAAPHAGARIWLEYEARTHDAAALAVPA